MKSAYELAMERLQKDAPLQALTDEQKEKLSEVDALYQSKIAEKEVFLNDLIAKAMAKRDFGEVAQLEEQQRREIARLKEKCEEEKEKVRSENDSGTRLIR